MRIYYDLHIHTGLSPCGSEDMTPNNIVNMAVLKELDCIAATDHNACGNAGVIARLGAEAGLIVVPGMEVCTSEEVHVLCLFPGMEEALAAEALVKERIPPVKNRRDIFGDQLFFDMEDNVTGAYEYLLTNATTLDIYELVRLTAEHGGVAIPAHIDRPSYSLISNLGFVPPDLDVGLVEISKAAEPEEYIAHNNKLFLKKYEWLQNSDAHYLEDISERVRYMEFETRPDARGVVERLRGFM
jgi:predicted metal-dependent phosphoesterase TrpH